MRITIAGGGNIGTQFAVHCAEKGHDVTVYTSSPELFDEHLYIIDEHENTTHEGNISCATDDPDKAFPDAELIIVTTPAMVVRNVAEIIYDHADKSSIIGVVPSNGGPECAFKKCIERGNTFFGLERVPAIARLVKKGQCVRSTGYRDTLAVASLPACHASRCADLISSIFDKNTIVIPNFLNLTLTPSNPILHTSRLMTLFEDWHEGVTYQSVPMFYEDWDNKSSELLIRCDEEVQAICRALPDFQLQYVKSLKVHYESQTAEAMTAKLSSIPAFKGLPTPTVDTGNGLIPDLHSRYFTSDFSFGLNIIKQIAVFANVETPNIDRVLLWYKQISVEKNEFRYSDYGIVDRDSFESFYFL